MVEVTDTQDQAGYLRCRRAGNKRMRARSGVVLYMTLLVDCVRNPGWCRSNQVAVIVHIEFHCPDGHVVVHNSFKLTWPLRALPPSGFTKRQSEACYRRAAADLVHA